MYLKNHYKKYVYFNKKKFINLIDNDKLLNYNLINWKQSINLKKYKNISLYYSNNKIYSKIKYIYNFKKYVISSKINNKIYYLYKYNNYFNHYKKCEKYKNKNSLIIKLII